MWRNENYEAWNGILHRINKLLLRLLISLWIFNWIKINHSLFKLWSSLFISDFKLFAYFFPEFTVREYLLPFWCECTNDFNEYLVSGDYVSGSNDFKSIYHRLHIVLGDFSKLHVIRMIFIQFQCDFMRLTWVIPKILKVWISSTAHSFGWFQ